jgi:hypothetical protein
MVSSAAFAMNRDTDGKRHQLFFVFASIACVAVADVDSAANAFMASIAATLSVRLALFLVMASSASLWERLHHHPSMSPACGTASPLR